MLQSEGPQERAADPNSTFRTPHFSMSSDTVITVENLSKRYIIGRRRCKHDGLRHILQDAASWPLRWLTKAASSNGANGNGSSQSSNSEFPATSSEEFWALRDVNLEIKQGPVVGIIGRNGGREIHSAQNSKLDYRTDKRTSADQRPSGEFAGGRNWIHPELSGRENIFLNEAILGMSHSEKKFDEIVDFAGIEQFLDTPVKRYSRGMYVHL